MQLKLHLMVGRFAARFMCTCVLINTGSLIIRINYLWCWTHKQRAQEETILEDKQVKRDAEGKLNALSWRGNCMVMKEERDL